MPPADYPIFRARNCAYSGSMPAAAMTDRQSLASERPLSANSAGVDPPLRMPSCSYFAFTAGSLSISPASWLTLSTNGEGAVCRHVKRVPGGYVEIRHAQFSDRRQFRRRREPFSGSHSETANLARSDGRQQRARGTWRWTGIDGFDRSARGLAWPTSIFVTCPIARTARR